MSSTLIELLKPPVVFRGFMYNDDFSLRWHIVVRQDPHSERYEVEDCMEYSVFPHPLGSGPTLDEAIKDFFKKEQQLIESL